MSSPFDAFVEMLPSPSRSPGIPYTSHRPYKISDDALKCIYRLLISEPLALSPSVAIEVSNNSPASSCGSLSYQVELIRVKAPCLMTNRSPKGPFAS